MGFSKLLDHILKQAESLDQVAVDHVDKVASTASAVAPRLTGELAGDWQRTEESGMVGIYNDDPAAVPQEYGTSRHDPQPFLRPAIFAHEGELTKAVRDHLIG